MFGVYGKYTGIGHDATRRRRTMATDESLGERITRRLGAFVKALESDEIMSQRFTCRRIELRLNRSLTAPN